MFKEKANTTNEKKMTPEEKLFHVIATGGQQQQSTFQASETLKEEVAALNGKGLAEQFLQSWQKYKKVVAGNASYISDPVNRWMEENKSAAIFGTESSRTKTLPNTAIIILGFIGLFLLIAALLGKNEQLKSLPGVGIIGIQNSLQYFTPAENSTSLTRSLVEPSVPAAKITKKIQTDAPAVEPYKLVGISWDEKEFIAMIEPAGQNAKFVRQGDTLNDGTKVEKVKEYTVVLSKNHRKWELR
jgi:hypothetical protein